MNVIHKASLVSVLVATISTAAPVSAGEPLWPPPTANWAGTTPIVLAVRNGDQIFAKRVGILAYCADLYHGAGDTGLQAGKVDVQNSSAKQALQAQFGIIGAPWFLDGPFDLMGHYGAQNVADYLAYDDSINRERDVEVIDGSLILPTATQLIQNFDILVAWTDNNCGQPIPTSIANSAANALAGFITVPGKKLILTGFAFSSSIGFGNAIFAAGLSPLKKGGPALDLRCNRGTPCPIGACPAEFFPTGVPAECRDAAGNFAFPTYQPFLGPDTDFACGNMLASVNGPTSSSWATALASPASLASGATLCFNYDIAAPALPFLAINAARNIIAINAFPPDDSDIQKFWFGCILGNALQFLSGDNRCTTQTCH